MAKKLTIVVIVFLAMFVLLGVFIAVRTTLIYRAATGYANETTTATIECVGYMYKVTDINYSDDRLSFDLENKVFSRYDIDKISIFSEKDQKEITVDVIIGITKRIEVDDFVINNSFLVAPAGCEVYGKTYEIR